MSNIMTKKTGTSTNSKGVHQVMTHSLIIYWKQLFVFLAVTAASATTTLAATSATIVLAL